MAYSLSEVIYALEKLAPKRLAFDWDNVGLQIGHEQGRVNKILLTLSITPEIVDKAISENVDLIIAHHPLIFKPLKNIRYDQPLGSMLFSLIKHNIAVYVAHTNLDQAELGLNHWLAEEFELINPTVLVPGLEEGTGLGRIGKIEPIQLKKLSEKIKAKWESSLRVIGEPTKVIQTLAIVGGSGGDFVRTAYAKGADLLITGDLSYHDALDALALGLCVIDAGHFSTEKIMVAKVADYLRDKFGSSLEIIEDCGIDPFAL